MEHSFTSSNLQTGGNKGSYFVSTIKTGIIASIKPMSPCDFNQLHVTFFNEGGFDMMFIPFTVEDLTVNDLTR